MVDIQIICPSCNKKGKIQVSENLIKNISRGLLAVNIVKDSICSHSFIAYIDKNNQIRDYFIVDFKIDLPELVPEEKQNSNIFLSADLINLDSIKLNLPPTTMSFIIRAIFLKMKILLISEQLFYFNHILNFFKIITKDSFILDLTILTKEDYEKDKNKYENSLVLENHKIIKDKDKIIVRKKLNIENFFINKFLVEPDLKTGLIFLRNDILKIYKLSESIIDFIRNPENKKRLQSINLIKYLNNKFDAKIPQQHLNFLLEIVENYFNMEIPKRLRVSFF